MADDMSVYIYTSVYVGVTVAFELTTSPINLKMSGILLNCL